MKRIKTIIALVAVALTLGLASCSKANPADEFASALDKLAKKTEAIKTQEDFQTLQSDVEAADAIAKDNASYELTAADKATIKKAMSNFMRAAFSRSFAIQGQEIPEAQLDMMVNMATASIDNATTLGDLSQPASVAPDAQDAPVVEETAVETVEEAPAE